MKALDYKSVPLFVLLLLDHGASYTEDARNIYWFEKNLQGDIIAVYDQAGNKLIAYKYDAWGNISETYYNNGFSTTAINNPFRYRGYYYDQDLGLYYLNTRYYDSNTGRFINADEVMSGVNGNLQGFNLYVYCFNNPVMHTDYTGNWPVWESIKKKLKEVKETCSIVFTEEFAVHTLNSVLSNLEAKAGITVGIGGEFKFGNGKQNIISLEACSRIDIVGIQLKDGKVRFGRTGRSALTIGIGDWTVGPQSDTYEPLDTGSEYSRSQTYYWENLKSAGRSAAYVVGYHYSISFSTSGFLMDIEEYINSRR